MTDRSTCTEISSKTGYCAQCLRFKPLPYRRDDLGGYVCLTCVEKYLNNTLAQLTKLSEVVEDVRQMALARKGRIRMADGKSLGLFCDMALGDYDRFKEKPV